MIYYCKIFVWMEMEKFKVLIQFLLIFRQSGDVLFFLYARRLRGYTATRVKWFFSSEKSFHVICEVFLIENQIKEWKIRSFNGKTEFLKRKTFSSNVFWTSLPKRECSQYADNSRPSCLKVNNGTTRCFVTFNRFIEVMILKPLKEHIFHRFSVLEDL